MDIDRIRYFLTFAETGSLVKSSEILHISQPALSKALRLLESEVGAKLTEPDGRGIRLTDAGQALKRETAGLLKEWLAIPERLKGAAEEKPLRIGSFEVFTTYFLGRLVETTDLGRLEIHELSPGLLEQGIQKGLVDVGITYVPIPTAGIDFTEVTRVQMGVFGSARKFKDSEFEDLPFAVPLLPAQGTPSKVIGLDGWPDHKLPRRVKYRVTMMESALQLCRRGHAVAYLPKFVVDLHNQEVRPEFKLTELEAPVPKKERMQSVFLVQKHGTRETALIRTLAKSIRALS